MFLMRFPGFAALLNSDNHFQNILRIFDFGQNAPPHPKINAAKVSKLTYASVVDVGKSICT